MRLTRSVGYAVSILLRVAADREASPHTAAMIADGCDFPPRFLYRVLRRLVDAGLLNGVSGPGGGYTLARTPREISLLDVVQAVEGPPTATELTPVHRKHKRALEMVSAVCVRSAESFARDLSRVSLARLSE